MVWAPRGADLANFACFSLVMLWLCAPRGADLLHLLYIFVHFLYTAPSAPLWLWAPRGADFAHFACFSLILGGWWGVRPRPRPLCGCGPLLWLTLLILLVFRWFWGAGWGCALGPSVVVCPSWG